jgi:DNA mismatch repair protein MutS2
MVSDTEPLSDLAEVNTQLGLVAELKEMASTFGAVGLGGLMPISGLIESLDNPAIALDPEEFLTLRDLLKLSNQVAQTLRRLDDRFGALLDFSYTFAPIDDLAKRIERSVDDNATVRMDASPELVLITTRLRDARETIKRRLESFVRDRNLEEVVQEDYVTMRNDRYVILLKPHFRGKLDGIIHDHSRSGSSVYVEPFEVVEANNKVAVLADEQRAAVRKVLVELTDAVRSHRHQLLENYERLVQLDAFQARALYATATASVVPEFVDEGFRIIGARHPLLIASSPTEVVPMDVIQDAETPVTIISGANMGGKTVALKIAGLFPLMIRCSLMIPAREGTKITPFTRVMADIGDEQDLRNRLSSFAGHMIRMKFILEEVRKGDLVLIDELGAATDPEEGSALGMAVLDELVAQGARVLVTTHLSQLKAYALVHDQARNVSVEFHPVTHQPTYRLIYDVPGESHAIQTAQRIGIAEGVLHRARGYLDKFAGGSSRLLTELRQKIIHYETLTQGVQESELTLRHEIEDLQSRKNQTLETFRSECFKMIREAERKIADIQKSLKVRLEKKSSSPREELKKITRELETALGVRIEPRPSPFSPGSHVRIPGLGKDGKITKVSESGLAEVAVGKLKVKVKLRDLTDSHTREEEKSASKIETIGVEIPITVPRWEVKIIGLRVDEAITVVEKAINDAFLGGLSEVSIIHGRGTGRLKMAIREYVSHHALVKQFRNAEFSAGGDAVTVVELAHS